jgi:hypothetical protein
MGTSGSTAFTRAWRSRARCVARAPGTGSAHERRDPLRGRAATGVGEQGEEGGAERLARAPQGSAAARARSSARQAAKSMTDRQGRCAAILGTPLQAPARATSERRRARSRPRWPGPFDGEARHGRREPRQLLVRAGEPGADSHARPREAPVILAGARSRRPQPERLADSGRRARAPGRSRRGQRGTAPRFGVTTADARPSSGGRRGRNTATPRLRRGARGSGGPTIRRCSARLSRGSSGTARFGAVSAQWPRRFESARRASASRGCHRARGGRRRSPRRLRKPPRRPTGRPLPRGPADNQVARRAGPTPPRSPPLRETGKARAQTRSGAGSAAPPRRRRRRALAHGLQRFARSAAISATRCPAPPQRRRSRRREPRALARQSDQQEPCRPEPVRAESPPKPFLRAWCEGGLGEGERCMLENSSSLIGSGLTA